MGADLYIKNMDRETQYTGFEVSDRAVDSGYFRDCYNSRGLFSVISTNTATELSWWWTVDRKDLFNGNNEMTVEGAKKWLSELEPIIKQLKQAKVLYYSDYNMDTKKHDKGEKIKGKKEYHDWADLLINFLRLAIKQKSPIIFSV